MKLETLTVVNAERAARRPVIVVTDTANGDQRLVKAKDIATDPLSAELAKQLRMGKSSTIESGGKDVSLLVAVAIDRRDLAGSRADYLRLLVPAAAAEVHVRGRPHTWRSPWTTSTSLIACCSISTTSASTLAR